MKKILLGIVAVVLVAVLAVLGLAATKPNQYRVVRSASVGAPPAVVFAQIDDFHQFPSWSPWQKLDPAMKTTFSGSERGMGAVYEWKGNKDAGSGRMTITESVPDDHVTMQLEFIEPFPSTAMTTLKLAPEGQGTTVEWSMEGNYDFFSKVMCVFMDMDKMIGKDFLEGLGNLDRVCKEAAAAAAAPTDSSMTPAAESEAPATH